jgi:AraC-like DNA-binding protein
MARLAQGRIVLWEGGGLWIFHVPAPPPSRKRTDFHAHHAIQVTLALDGGFDLYLPDAVLPGPAVIVSPDVSHAFEPLGLMTILFIDPESAAGRALRAGMLAGRQAAVIPDRQARPLRQAARALHDRPGAADAEWRELGQRLIGDFVGAVEAAPADPRIETALEWAGAHLDQPIGISDLARELGLSPDRVSHLFVEQTGLPFRTYLLWLRIRRALDAYAHGQSLTTAAYDAGFSDSAHFSRTFRRMFGVAAAQLQLA